MSAREGMEMGMLRVTETFQTPMAEEISIGKLGHVYTHACANINARR